MRQTSLNKPERLLGRWGRPIKLVGRSRADHERSRSIQRPSDPGVGAQPKQLDRFRPVAALQGRAYRGEARASRLNESGTHKAPKEKQRPGRNDGATLHRRPKPSRDHHGSVGRDDHAWTVGGARQQDRASLASRRPQQRRPLRHLYGKPSAPDRMRNGRRALRSLLHRRQFLSHARRARLYPKQQPLAGPLHVAIASCSRPGSAARLPWREAHPRRRWGRRR